MIQKVLDVLKIAALNDMQAAAIKVSKSNKDVILLSPTGSGKTLGFLLPLLEKFKSNNVGVQALIIVPTRELAIQIEQVFKSMSTGFKINCCYGGHSTKIEKNNLEHPPTILVGTPGRLAFHVRNNSFDVNVVNFLVLDEFDKSLEYGFQEDMQFIISQLKHIKNRMLISATQLDEIPDFVGIKNPEAVNFLNNKNTALKGLSIKTVQSDSKDKFETLFKLLCKLGDTTSLVFCNHRESVERTSELLWDKGIPHGVFHGGLEQIDRERTLIKFRNGTHKILITTDLVARGIDILQIENVIHYQLPFTEDSFIHRNGRTARMNNEGTVFLILSEDEKLQSFIPTTNTPEILKSTYQLPSAPKWTTIYIGLGKKDKVNKIDIVGLFLKKGNLDKMELGLVEVLDFSSYVAVLSSKADTLLKVLQSEKIKNKKVKIEIAK